MALHGFPCGKGDNMPVKTVTTEIKQSTRNSACLGVLQNISSYEKCYDIYFA